MRRTAFDTLMAAAGLVLAVILAVAGGLLFWANNFVTGQVHDQLVAQKIFFPPAGSEGLPAAEFPQLQQYGGKQVVNGEMAKAYANDFIGAHIKGIAGGKTYSELSTESRANPDNQELAGQVQTIFRGETLRGLLLNAYAFGTMAKIAAFAAWAAVAGAAVMLVLSGMGMVHARRTSVETEVLIPHRAPATV